MRLNKYSWLAVLPMIFTACQDDTLVENQQQDKIYTLSATMDGGAAMSRAQIVIGNDAEASAGETFMWNEGDSFVMYQNINDKWNKSTFTISGYSEEETSTSATFKTNNAATEGVSFKAFYPTSQLNEYDEFGAHLPESIEFSSNKTIDDVWKEYFNEWMMMEATGVLTGTNPTIEFEHKCCLARITYTNKTGKDIPITRYYLEGNNTWLIGVAYYHNPTSGEILYGAQEQKYGLKVTGLTVPANESVDLYLLFYPHEFGDNTSLYVGVEHQENDCLKAKIELSEIANQNNNVTAFEAGKRYWFKVTETLTGLEWTKEYKEKRVDVTDFDGFIDAVNIEDATHVALKNPIIINAELENLNIGLGNKIITLSEDFSWEINGEEQNALFVNNNKYLRFEYGRIEANETISDGKYLFESTAASSDLLFNDVDLSATGKMNAIKLENANSFYLNGNTLSRIDVENGYVFYITSSDKEKCEVFINYNGIINGDVYYENNYKNYQDPSYLKVWSGTINGDLTICGDYPGYLKLEGTEKANGTGWTQETIAVETNSFVQALCDDYYNFVTSDGEYVYINKAFAESLTSLDLKWKGLTELTGIETFENLTELDCSSNNLTTIDFSGLTQLEKIICNDNNNLTSLVLPSCITHIECENNSLSELDLTHCTSEAIYILCGRQGESTGTNLTITLKLTEAMKNYWKTYLYNKGNNGVRVKIDGDTSINVPSLDIENW